METITNPLVRVPRLGEIMAFARQEGLMTVIDSTFASPDNFRPIGRLRSVLPQRDEVPERALRLVAGRVAETLALLVAAQNANAMALARLLTEHSKLPR